MFGGANIVPFGELWPLCGFIICCAISVYCAIFLFALQGESPLAHSPPILVGTKGIIFGIYHKASHSGHCTECGSDDNGGDGGGWFQTNDPWQAV